MPTKSADLCTIMSSDVLVCPFDEFNCHYVNLDSEYTCSDLTIRITLISYTWMYTVLEVSIHGLLKCWIIGRWCKDCRGE